MKDQLIVDIIYNRSELVEDKDRQVVLSCLEISADALHSFSNMPISI